MYSFIVGFLIPKMKSLNVALISVGICFVAEILQLYQANWIESFRETMIDALVLGHGFLWSDLLMLTLGKIKGYWFEKKCIDVS